MSKVTMLNMEGKEAGQIAVYKRKGDRSAYHLYYGMEQGAESGQLERRRANIRYQGLVSRSSEDVQRSASS